MLHNKIYTGIWCGNSSLALQNLANNHLATSFKLDLTNNNNLLSGALASLDQDEGSFSFIATPLSDCPTTLPDNLIFAALSPREEPSTYMFTKQDKLDFSQDLFLSPGSKVFCSNPRIAEQLEQVRNDLIWTIHSETSESLPEHDALITLLGAPTDETADWNKRLISPWECIPSPGAGAVVYICRKNNIELRRKFRAIHSETSSRCTNVERKLLKNMPNEIKDYFSAYTYQDTIGHFHMAVHIGHPSFPSATWRQSNSSSTQLEAKMLESCNVWLTTYGLPQH